MISIVSKKINEEKLFLYFLPYDFVESKTKTFPNGDKIFTFSFLNYLSKGILYKNGKLEIDYRFFEPNGIFTFLDSFKEVKTPYIFDSNDRRLGKKIKIDNFDDELKNIFISLEQENKNKKLNLSYLTIYKKSIDKYLFDKFNGKLDFDLYYKKTIENIEKVKKIREEKYLEEKSLQEKKKKERLDSLYKEFETKKIVDVTLSYAMLDLYKGGHKTKYFDLTCEAISFADAYEIALKKLQEEKPDAFFISDLANTQFQIFD